MDPEGKKPRIGRRKAAGMGDNSEGRGYLDGRLLIAMPVMGDPRFERSVIYLCAHSSEGAMGIIVNRPAGSIDFRNCWCSSTSSRRPTRSSCRKMPKP
jgi:putative transcriptional regulator